MTSWVDLVFTDLRQVSMSQHILLACPVVVGWYDLPFTFSFLWQYHAVFADWYIPRLHQWSVRQKTCQLSTSQLPALTLRLHWCITCV